jgi:molybdopterin-biosynthesis enzyme MoeA-like protein
MESTMSVVDDDLSKLLPSAKQVMEQLALTEAEKASEAMRQKAKADAEKKALLDRLTKPSGVSEEERLKRAATIIQRAVKNGLSEVEVGRFPNSLCTDHGRAINNELEPGWEKTLTGLPKELYEFWERQLKPRGYKIKFQVVDFSGGVPGDIGITLKWG